MLQSNYQDFSREELVTRLHNLEQALAHSMDGVLVLNQQGQILFANKVAAKIVRMEVKDMLNMNALSFFEEEEKMNFSQLLQEMQPHDRMVLEAPIHRHDGEPAFLWLKILPSEHAEGNYVAVVRDVTEQRDHEAELMKNNHELKQMNKAMVGRELKMAELKAEIAELKEKLASR